MKKRRIGAVGGIFLAAMVVLTFCSRTIYHMMLPTVQTAVVSGGILTYEAQAYEWLLGAENTISISLGEALPEAIRIERILLREKQYVEQGEALVQLYALDAERALEAAQTEWRRAQLAYAQWEVQALEEYAACWDQLRMENISAEEQGVLQQRLELIGNGVAGGTSKELCLQECARTERMVTMLQTLQANHWQIRSPHSGWICELPVESGTDYDGISPLAVISDAGADVLIGVAWSQPLDLDRQAARVIAEAVASGRRIECEYVKTTEVDGQQIAWLKCSEIDGLTGVSLRAETEYVDLVIPADALQDDRAYVLTTNVGPWGATESTVQMKKLSLGRRNEQWVEVTGGLFVDDTVVTEASRPLQSGDRVVIQGNYR